MVSLGRIDDFVDRVDKSIDLKTVIAALSAQIESLGFEYFNLQVLHALNGPCPKGDITTFPQQWVERYNDQRYISCDMVSRHAAISINPFSWADTGNSNDFTGEQKRVFDEAAEFGLNSGGVVPLHGPGPMKGLLSVASSSSKAEFKKFFLERRHELQLIASYAYERAFALGYFSTEPINFKLTPRESEVMNWTARGKTVWEIAKILRISDETVQIHIGNAGDKLNATNKTHAAVVAVTNSLIVP